MRHAPAALITILALPMMAQTAPAPPMAQARFLSKEEAAKVLVASDYFDLLHTPELRAKTGLALAGMTTEQARAAAKAFYAASAQDFSAEEKAMLQGILDRVAPALMTKLPLMARTPFTFIKAGIEGGLPHTRGACIVLSPMMLAALAHTKELEAEVPGGAAGLLVHEQTHVLERQHPELFAQLFTEVFGFKRITVAPDAPELAEKRVVNPDGPDLAWAFPIHANGGTRWIRPDLQLGELEHPRMPQDFQMIAVDLDEKGGAFTLARDAKGNPEVENLSSLKDYESAFADVGEDFHPNEIAAVLLSGWVTDSDKDSGQPLRVRTDAWAEKALR